MIRLSIPMLPPTDNNAYENIPVRRIRGKPIGGGRRLSEEGRAFKLEATNHLARHHTIEIGLLKKNVLYVVWLVFWFPELTNKGWPKKTDTRYKKLDGTNRDKLLLDVLAELTGVDDSQYSDVVVSKREGEPRVDVCYWNTEEEEAVLVFGKET